MISFLLELRDGWRRMWPAAPAPKPPISVAVACFLEQPTACFWNAEREPYAWPSPAAKGSRQSLGCRQSLPMLYVRSCGHSIGYVEGMNIQDDGSALILHFATAIAVQRMGVGTCLARTLATILKQKYGVSRIVFCERHPRDHDAAFFRSLGATPSRGHNNSSHGWHWEL